MTTKQVIASSLKVGGYVLFEDKAYVVKSIQISKTGKHGHAKCRIEATNIIDNTKAIKILPGHDKVDVPIIEKKSAQVLSLQEGKANVMDMESYETFDLDIPEEMKEEVKEGQQVVYWIILGKKVLKQAK